MRTMIRVILQLSASVLLFLVTRALVVEMYKIPTPSMQSTLMVGDFLVVDKMVYGPEIPFTHYRLPGLRAPRRGDVIIFKWPVDPSVNFVKRVVGVPGDTLLMHDGLLVRNGHSLAEGYVTHASGDADMSADEFRWQRDYLVRSARASGTYWPSRNNWGPLVVPPHDLFVLGDNRDNSLDSRYWGFVPDSLVRGTPMFVYFSYRPDSASRLSWLTNARWRRLGTVVR
ncbi:MAG: signal peptidase I [Gemmatimonadota bacterium]|nr:signal peptidase I [Gemmatimonadota bacterium]